MTMIKVGSPSDVIKMAVSQIGISESPPNSNKVKYNTWYYGKEVSGKAYPWCMVFCQWVYDQCNIRLPSNTASCTMMGEAAKNAGIFKNSGPKPGDLVLLRFKPTGGPTHCGIVEKISGTNVICIEGNTSYGNDTNGGSVMRRTRTAKNIYGLVRPTFGSDLPKEKGVEDMTIDEFIYNLTDKQAYALLEKAMKHAAKQPLPAWMKGKDKEYWDAAVKQGIITGEPERPVKRDELAIILGRMNAK